jgi:hypothetical protein
LELPKWLSAGHEGGLKFSEEDIAALFAPLPDPEGKTPKEKTHA